MCGERKSVMHVKGVDWKAGGMGLSMEAGMQTEGADTGLIGWR